MSKHDFDSILDECLRALAQGESLESCLARYPQHAQELRSLLSLAQAVRRTPLATPGGQAQAAAWQRFYRRASDLRAARQRRRFGWLRLATITAALLFALFAAGGGTIYAASRGLPDSPLYRVKLFTEEARLWFVFDDEEEADILLSQAETRIDEMMALVQEGKPVPENVLSALRRRTEKALGILQEHPGDAGLLARGRELTRRHENVLVALWENVSPEARRPYASALAALHNAQLTIAGEGQAVATFNPQDLEAGVLEVSGAAQPLATVPGVWTIGGVQVLVDQRSLGHEDIASDRLIRAIIARGTDGRLHALRLTVGPEAEEEENIVISGVVESVSDDEVRVAGHRFALTEETLARLRLQSGQRVQVAVSTRDGRVVAAQVKPLEEEANALIVYEGTIEGEASFQQEVNHWLIGGESFLVPQNVALDALAGEATPGARVRVEAVRQDDGLVANRIIVLASEGEPGDQVDLEGVLAEVTAQGRWRVSGFLVEAPSQQPPPLGSTIKVQGQRRGQEIVARSVFVLHEPDEENGLVQVRGLILRIQDGRWRVGIVTVVLSEDTAVSGQPIVGARALVWGRPSGRGTLEAAYIDVLDSKPFIPSRRPSEERNAGPSGASGPSVSGGE